MATLALGLAGPALSSALAGSGYAFTLFGSAALHAGLVGAASAIAGGYIDSRYLFASKSAASRGVDDFALSLGSEGTPLPRPWGAAVRVPGTVIWHSRVISAPVTSGSTKSGKITNKNYYASIAISMGDGSHNPSSPLILWADGKQIYNIDGIDLSNTSDLMSVVTVKWQSITVNRMEIRSTSGGPDLTQYKTGKNATVTGFNNGGNNVTGKVLFTGPWSGGGTKMHIANTGAVTEAAGAGATIDQTVDALDKSRVTSLTKYRGTTTQTADTIIESFEGAGNVPAFRDTHYCVLEKVYLGPYGNRLPQFQALVRKSSSQTMQTVIGSLLLAAGLDAADYDVSALSGNVAGYSVPGPEAAGDSIARLITAYSLIVQEVGGKLRFMHRASPDAITLREADLAAHESGTDTARPLEIEDARGLDLPAEVNVAYQDPDADYQRGLQKFRRVDPDQLTVEVVDLFGAPVVLTSAEALALAKRALWTRHVNRQVMRLQLPPSMWHLAENDLATVESDGESYTMLVVQANRGRNGVVAVEAVIEQGQVL